MLHPSLSLSFYLSYVVSSFSSLCFIIVLLFHLSLLCCFLLLIPFQSFLYMRFFFLLLHSLYVWISSLVLPNLSSVVFSQLHSSPLLAEYYSLFSQIISFPFSVMSLSASSKRSRKRSIKKYTDSKNRNDADGSADGYTIERIKDTL
uniref:Uncharacterized protein n=1 Tax=Cacopsylla melanoneura TaxID=428564 RepID=A0A8D8TIW6_9HEMI